MIEVPANYFGKGELYILKEDSDEMAEFVRRFDLYAEAHPNDPTGEEALRLHLAATKNPVSVYLQPIPAPPPPEALPFVELQDYRKTPPPVHPPIDPKEKEIIPQTPFNITEEWEELKLKIPIGYYNNLKNYAKWKRRRPRDVVMKWIRDYCHLNENQ